MAAKVPQTMADSAAHVETCLRGPYVMGDQFTLADPYLFTVCTWLAGDSVDIAAFPKLAAFFDLMQTRPSVQAALATGLLSL